MDLGEATPHLVSDHGKTLDNLNLEVRDTKGRTVFLQAAFLDGEVSTLKMLKERGAIANATDNYKRTALHLAAMQYHVAAMEYLLTLKLEANAVDDFSRMPHHLAALTGADKCLKILLHEPGVDIESLDNYERTALHLAAKNNHLSTCEYLLSLGAKVCSVDNYGRQPHHLAALKGAKDTLKRLLCQPDCDINAVDNFNHTSLYLATYKKREEERRVEKREERIEELRKCINILLENGADPDAGTWDDCPNTKENSDSKEEPQIL